MTWIEIDKELPGPLQEVLVAIPVDVPQSDKRYLKDIAFIRHDGSWFRVYSEEDEEIHPSHWMAWPDDPHEMNVKWRLQ